MASASAFLNARAHALIGLLLSREVILRLADSPSAEALDSELSAMGYFRALEAPGQRAFSQRMSWELDADYRSTLLVLPQGVRGLVRAMYRLREVSFLKAAFGCANRQVPQASRAALLGGLHLLNIADEGPLYQAVDLREAVSKTPEPYRAAADNALHQVEEQGSLFPIEIALDLLALHELWLAGRALTGMDRARVAPIFGVWFDMFNVLSAARLRLNYVASSDEALGYLIHHGLHLRLSHRRALAGVEKLADLAIVLRDTPYPPRFGEADSLRAIETGMMRAFQESVKACLVGYPFHLGSTVAYLLLKQIEITNLTRVHDAKRRDAQNVPWADLLV
jgi:vacuolar-type H+-ATPase subunit C/Vma6